MVEVLGAIETTFALAGIVVHCVKIARDLYKGPEEIRELEKQVSGLHSVLSTLKTLETATFQTALAESLNRAQGILKDLSVLLDTKLLKRGKASSFAWLRHKDKVVLLCTSLRVAKEELSLALQSELIAVVHRIEEAVTIIAHRNTFMKRLFAGIKRGLKSVKHKASRVENPLTVVPVAAAVP